MQLIISAVKEKSACEGFSETPLHVNVFCPNGKSLGSVCEFECSIGFIRVGAATSTCIHTKEGAQWSHPTPICRPGKTGKFVFLHLLILVFVFQNCVCNYRKK